MYQKSSKVDRRRNILYEYCWWPIRTLKYEVNNVSVSSEKHKDRFLIKDKTEWSCMIIETIICFTLKSSFSSA